MPSEKKSPKKKVEKPSDLELAKAFALAMAIFLFLEVFHFHCLLTSSMR